MSTEVRLCSHWVIEGEWEKRNKKKNPTNVTKRL